jgi:hypothetical protein
MQVVHSKAMGDKHIRFHTGMRVFSSTSVHFAMPHDGNNLPTHLYEVPVSNLNKRMKASVMFLVFLSPLRK